MSRLGHRASSINESVYNGTISVSVRPKPPSEHSKSSWVIDSEENTIFSPELGDFTFDSVFGLGINNLYVYENSVSQVVQKALNGFNGTVFAYGMTGSGKTHSMQGTDLDPGVIPLAVADIFNYIEASLHAKKYSVKVSYLEIYNERIFDLLALSDPIVSPNATSSYNNTTTNVRDDLKIRDDPLVGVKVMGLSEESASSVEQLLNIISRGDLARKTGATDFNSRSSRSHAVVLIRLGCIDLISKAETISTLSLCDLAGSERATTQTDRRKEGSFINKSLLALSSVIAKLSVASTVSRNGNGVGHIPYRDSKLTRLLQPALSGNSVISILCTIHLGDNTFSETVNTLRFAAKAKNVTLNVSKHELVGAGGNSDKIIEKLQTTIEKQKAEIDLLKASQSLNNLSISNNNNADSTNQRTSTSSFSSLSTTTPSSPLLENSEHLKTEIAQLRSENRILNEQHEHLTRLNDERRTEHVIIKNEIFNVLMSTRALLNDTTTIRNLEELFKQHLLEIEEYKSYISHLENELGKYEIKRYFGNLVLLPLANQSNSATTITEQSSNINTVDNNNYNKGIANNGIVNGINNGNGYHYIYPENSAVSLNGLISPSKVRNSILMNGSTRELQSLVESQLEEIDELKETLKDKDRIIKALRTSSRFKNSLAH